MRVQHKHTATAGQQEVNGLQLNNGAREPVHMYIELIRNEAPSVWLRITDTSGFEKKFHTGANYPVGAGGEDGGVCRGELEIGC